MQTCPNTDRLGEFIQGKLPLSDHLVIEQHLEQCHSCQDTIAVLDDDSVMIFGGKTGDKGGARQQPDASVADDSPALEKLIEQAKRIRTQTADEAISFKASTLLESRPPFEQGAMLGNYVLGELLGSGSMGFVYRAYHKRMKRDVALKFVSTQLLHSGDARQRFQREIEAVAKLDHPHVVAAFDADEVDGYSFLVMELVRGDDLRTVINSLGKPLPVERALRYVQQAAEGLAYAHKLGVVHRDIKPSNLLLDEHDCIKVTDLGLARLEQPPEHVDEPGENSHEVSRTGLVAGTPAYMAPEQCVDLRQTDQRSDIYSLGCTLFFLLTSRNAFEQRGGVQAMLAQRFRPLPPMRDFRPDVSKELEDLCRAMTATAPADRPASMREVVGRIEAILTGDEGNVSTQPRQRNGVLTAARLGVGSLVVSIVIFIVYAGQRFDFGRVATIDPSVTGGGANADIGSRSAGGGHSPGAKLNTHGAVDSNAPQIEMVTIRAGKFTMGSSKDQGFPKNESPAHEVEITKPFLLGKFEVTHSQFYEVMGGLLESGSSASNVLEPTSESDSTREAISDRPVVGVRWREAIEFCNHLSRRHGLKPYYDIRENAVTIVSRGNGYRLPTEAEWEYACRAGSDTTWPFGETAERLDEFAWFASNSDGNLRSVGGKKPNAFGLHDMLGNVPEWCWDRYDPAYYQTAQLFDPPGSGQGERRVYRGGGVQYRSGEVRSAVRNTLGEHYGVLNLVGFRVARSLPLE